MRCEVDGALQGKRMAKQVKTETASLKRASTPAPSVAAKPGLFGRFGFMPILGGIERFAARLEGLANLRIFFMPMLFLGMFSKIPGVGKPAGWLQGKLEVPLNAMRSRTVGEVGNAPSSLLRKAGEKFDKQGLKDLSGRMKTREDAVAGKIDGSFRSVTEKLAKKMEGKEFFKSRRNTDAIEKSKKLLDDATTKLTGLKPQIIDKNGAGLTAVADEAIKLNKVRMNRDMGTVQDAAVKALPEYAQTHPQAEALRAAREVVGNKEALKGVAATQGDKKIRDALSAAAKRLTTKSRTAALDAIEGGMGAEHPEYDGISGAMKEVSGAVDNHLADIKKDPVARMRALPDRLKNMDIGTATAMTSLAVSGTAMTARAGISAKHGINSLRHMLADIKGVPVNQVSRFEALRSKEPIVAAARKTITRNIVPEFVMSMGQMGLSAGMLMGKITMSGMGGVALAVGPQMLMPMIGNMTQQNQLLHAYGTARQHPNEETVAALIAAAHPKAGYAPTDPVVQLTAREYLNHSGLTPDAAVAKLMSDLNASNKKDGGPFYAKSEAAIARASQQAVVEAESYTKEAAARPESHVERVMAQRAAAQGQNSHASVRM